MHGPADALAYGVKVTGCTVFFVAGGIDDGPMSPRPRCRSWTTTTPGPCTSASRRRSGALLVDAVGRLARQGWTIDNRKVTIP